jgi:hypothetical protein
MSDISTCIYICCVWYTVILDAASESGKNSGILNKANTQPTAHKLNCLKSFILTYCGIQTRCPKKTMKQRRQWALPSSGLCTTMEVLLEAVFSVWSARRLYDSTDWVQFSQWVECSWVEWSKVSWLVSSLKSFILTYCDIQTVARKWPLNKWDNGRRQAAAPAQ